MFYCEGALCSGPKILVENCAPLPTFSVSRVPRIISRARIERENRVRSGAFPSCKARDRCDRVFPIRLPRLPNTWCTRLLGSTIRVKVGFHCTARVPYYYVRYSDNGLKSLVVTEYCLVLIFGTPCSPTVPRSWIGFNFWYRSVTHDD